MVLMYRHSRSMFLQVIFNFETEKMNINGRYSEPKFAHTFDFYCLTNLTESIDLSGMVSLWCKLLCKRSIYILKSDQWITRR